MLLNDQYIRESLERTFGEKAGASIDQNIKAPPGDDDDYGYIETSPTIPPKPPGGVGSAKLKFPTVTLKKKAESELYCKHCGAELPKGQTICHVCGKKVE